MTPLILVIQILSRFIGVYSQNTTYNSYCLTGLSPSEYGSFIAARYENAGIDERRKYFTNTQLPDEFSGTVYLYWDTHYDKWYISDNLSSSEYWAYCSYSSLDSCTNGRWYRYDGISTKSDYSMSIGPCTYDNNICLTQYNNTFGKTKHSEKDFCIRNTRHRAINSGIAGAFSIDGCYEQKPYYAANVGDVIVSWDNEMSVWQLNHQYDVVAWHAVGYCTDSSLDSCTGNWYIWDGTDETKDSKVMSGLCDACTDTKYDTFCIYGGLHQEQLDEIVGIYKYDKCVELMHSYNHTKYYNLTLHYYCAGNSWHLDFDYNPNTTIGLCDEQDNIMECAGNWSVFDPIDVTFDIENTVQSGSCDIIYQQCFNEQYLCISEDENDASVINNEFYYQYLAGEFKYLECDEEGFPIYVRHKDNDGNYLNKEWSNYTMITWDSTLNIFSVHKYNKTLTGSNKGHWLYCRALLIELCDTFWNLFHNGINSGKWIPQKSIRVSKTKCPIHAHDENTIYKYLFYGVIIGVLVLLICCGFCGYCKYNYKNDSKNNTKHTFEVGITGYKQNTKNNNGRNASVHEYNYEHVTQQSEQSNLEIANSVFAKEMMKDLVRVKTDKGYQWKNTKSYGKTPKKKQTPQYINTKYQTQKHQVTPKPKQIYCMGKPTTRIDIDPAYILNGDTKPTPKYSVNAPEMKNVNNNDINNVVDERQTFVQNDTQSESEVANWTKSDIIEWINSVGLKEQWKQIALDAVQNGQYNGHDLMQIKSGKDIAKLFGIQNPMLCSRLWKELKKIK